MDRYNQLISEVRNRVRCRLIAELVDERDLEQLLPDNSFVHGFVFTKQSDEGPEKDAETEAVAAIDACLRWRNQIRVNDLQLNNFPSELIEKSCFLMDQKPPTPTLYFRVRYLKRISHKWTEILERYFAMFVEHFYRHCRHGRFVVDASKVRLENLDLPLMTQMVKILGEYYPTVIDKVIIIDGKWIARPLMALIRSRLPHSVELRHISNREALQEFDRRLPDFLGGSLDLSVPMPNNILTIDELAPIVRFKDKNLQELKIFYVNLH